MASPTQWANSRGWWRTGEPGMLQAMGSQRVRLKRLNNYHQGYPAVKFWWILELLRSPPWPLLSSRWRRCVPSSVWLGPCGPREQTQEGILWNSHKGLRCASGESFVCVCVHLWFLVSPLFIQFPWFNFTSLFSLIQGTAPPGLLGAVLGRALCLLKHLMRLAVPLWVAVVRRRLQWEKMDSALPPGQRPLGVAPVEHLF